MVNLIDRIRKIIPYFGHAVLNLWRNCARLVFMSRAHGCSSILEKAVLVIL